MMPKKRSSTAGADLECAGGQLILSGKLHLAAALISNATSAMSAENQARLLQGREPPYSYGSFWAEVGSIYDQLGLPHHSGVILTEELFGTFESN